MTGTIRIGCSGWQYRHWRGLFYPEGLAQKNWFALYAASFETVEINASFYRVPLTATFIGWRDKAPSGFRYAVKANRFITHTKKLKDVTEPLGEFLGRTRGLGEALGRYSTNCLRAGAWTRNVWPSFWRFYRPTSNMFWNFASRAG